MNMLNWGGKRKGWWHGSHFWECHLAEWWRSQTQVWLVLVKITLKCLYIVLWRKFLFWTLAPRSVTVKLSNIEVMADRRHSVNRSTDCTSFCCCDICKDLWLGNSSPGLLLQKGGFTIPNIRILWGVHAERSVESWRWISCLWIKWRWLGWLEHATLHA